MLSDINEDDVNEDNKDSDNEEDLRHYMEYEMMRKIRECEKTMQFLQDRNEVLE